MSAADECEVEGCSIAATERRAIEETLETGVWMHLCASHAAKLDETRLADAVRILDLGEPPRH